MPVDYFIALIPLIFLIAVLVAIIFKKIRIYANIVVLIALSSFVWIYLAPEWLVLRSANKGDAKAQLELGYYYWTRFGYMGSDMEKSNYWFLRAAESGNPHAMALVGESWIEKDKSKALFWLNAAAKAGDGDAIEDLKRMAQEKKNN